MYLNRITLIGFLGDDAEKKVSNATNIAVFSLATKASWKNDAGFYRLAELVGTLSKGAHVAVEGELRSHKYQREVVLGEQKTGIQQRVWEVPVDSVLKLNRAAKREPNVEKTEEVPR
jgi:single-strand DNA-binding protein